MHKWCCYCFTQTNDRVLRDSMAVSPIRSACIMLFLDDRKVGLLLVRIKVAGSMNIHCEMLHRLQNAQHLETGPAVHQTFVAACQPCHLS